MLIPGNSKEYVYLHPYTNANMHGAYPEEGSLVSYCTMYMCVPVRVETPFVIAIPNRESTICQHSFGAY